MGRLVANRPVPLTMVAVLLIAGCAGGTGALPTATQAPSPIPSPIPTPTATPTATPTSTSTGFAVPTPTGWREVPPQDSVNGVWFLDVVWTGERFVAIGPSADGTFLDSMDGVTWHRQPGSVWQEGPSMLAAGPSGLVAIGSIGIDPGAAIGSIGEPYASWSSVDGLTWVAHPNAFPMPAVGEYELVEITDVVARGDGWLAVGQRCNDEFGCGVASYVWTSSDGAHWTRVADQKALKRGGMEAVARGDDGFVAVGGGMRWTKDRTALYEYAALWTSPDGLAWSRVPDDPMFHSGTEAKGVGVLATGVAARDGVVVVLATADSDPPAMLAWWSTSGGEWSKASVERAVGSLLFSAAATPDGFLAIGQAAGRPSCLGGIWASTDGRAWRCEAADSQFKGFNPDAAAASDTVDVAAGLADLGDEERPTLWYRTRP